MSALINKWLGFEYFWAWCIPMVMVLMYFGPNDVHPTEVITCWVLTIGWWCAYPPQLIKKIKHPAWPWVIWWCALGFLIEGAYTHLIQL